MKLNIVFLLVGLILTITSKFFQFTNKEKIGNVLVIPAAIFFVLAIIFSLSKVKNALDKVEHIKYIVGLSIWACIGVVSFQIMFIILFGSGNKFALFFIVIIVFAMYMTIKQWHLI